MEIAPLAALASLPLPRRGGSLGPAALACESALGALLVYGLHQALLTALRSEALVRRGELKRACQRRLVLNSAWTAVRDGAGIGLVLSLLLLIMPWLTFPFAVLSVVGVGRASLDLAHAFWDGLSPVQRAELHEAAFAAGVNLNRLLSA
ncbi:MAG: hypothetical protein ACKO0M_01910 [Cyanobium sp.]